MTMRKAFTLVELLVVIAIISLLIAILVPTLQGARQLALSAYCRSNLNALAKSVAIYSDFSNGYMMVYRHAFVTVNNKDYIIAPEQPSKTSIAFVSSPLNPATGLLSAARNYGLVYAAGIITKPEMFYCPAPIRDERAKFNSYPKPWGAHLGSGSQWIRCGYMWNPWVTVLEGDDASNNLCTYDDGLLLERHPQGRFLVSDLAWSTDVSGHAWGGMHHWNAGFADGHAESFQNKRLYNTYVNGLDAGVQWRVWNDVTRPALIEAGVGG